MAIKHEYNLVGILMLVMFLMGAVVRYGYEALRSMIGKGANRDTVEMVFMFPLSLGTFGFLCWVLFDSSWLNFDDEEKEKELKTKRWVKFLVLFILPAVKLATSVTWDKSNLTAWGIEIAHQIQDFLVILLAYFSLCVSHGSGLGRLFQPYTVPRSRIYTDEKGQKFEVNFIGTTLSILLIVWPSWQSMAVSTGRLFLYFTGNVGKVVAASAPTAKFLSNAPEGRAIADGVVMAFILYTFVVTFASCVKVTFFLKGNYNYLKFAPIVLTPLSIVFTDMLCVFGVTPYGTQAWITMMCYVLVSLAAYVSLVSPPDSLTAVLFQPHVPMINIVTDLPDMKSPPYDGRPYGTAVFPDSDSSISTKN